MKGFANQQLCTRGFLLVLCNSEMPPLPSAPALCPALVFPCSGSCDELLLG